MRYPLQWVSAIDPENFEKLHILQNKMSEYYAKKEQYYEDISDSESLWIDDDYLPYKIIKAEAFKAKSILEIGCGRSSILKYYPQLASKYWGIDFSNKLIESNRSGFPNADFLPVIDPLHYPFENNSFEFIFSVFVIEHTVFPNIFLNECIRILKPGGKLIILAPDYLDFNWMASQQTNPCLSSGSELLRLGKFYMAARAFLYNKVLVPMKCKCLRKKMPGFFVNLNPICFAVNEFRPDVDATYVVSGKEIRLYLLENDFDIIKHDPGVNEFIQHRRLCFVKAMKKI